MSDLQWCTTCDKAIQAYSNSLYCSEECLRQDAINHHPMLGYDFAEFKDFPRRSSMSPSMVSLSPTLSTTSTMSSVSPTLSPLPSTFALHRPQPTTATSYVSSSSLSDDILHLDDPTLRSKNPSTKLFSSSHATLVDPSANKPSDLFFV
ncbi:hypothetical protein [Absidia glauca]|uniref:Uncharacterized protein n=1 Tax=Absidia glauca TaxID=4829 RepID=A0A168M8J7_ABSGL|nr:hypothetical protein [Absidia glauca]